MPSLPTNGLLTADGTYDLQNIERGREHLLTAQGDPGGGTLKLQAPTGPGAAFTDVADASWTAPFEARFVSPGNSLRLVLTGSSTPSLQITLTPIN